MPAPIIAFNVSTLSQAGPMVAMTLVLRSFGEVFSLFSRNMIQAGL